MESKDRNTLLAVEGGKNLTAFDTAWGLVKADTGMWDEIYADLYEKPRRSVLRRRKYRRLIKTAKRKGRRITSPSIYYTVKKGDSLWSVSRKSGTSLYTIIASNMRIVKRRQIRAGDRLVVK